MKNHDALYSRLYKEQSGVCWKCGRPLGEHAHIHHGVFTRNNRFSEWLDTAENCILVCWRCHANHGSLSNYYTRKAVWEWKVSIGYEMQKWMESIPFRVRERFHWR